MTPKEKFNDIDFSKVPEKAQIAAKTIKPALFDKKYQAEQYTDTRKQAESQMNVLYDKLLKSYPESIKSKAAKQPEPKTPQAMAVQAAQATIKQPTVKKPKATAGANNRGNVTKLAKEIRKEGEAWHAAMKRAGEMVNKEKGKAVKKANAQYEKLKAFLAKNPSIEKTMVTYGKKPNQGTRPLDVRRDASRVAKPKGKRISADGKTYYEYRANRTDSSRKRYPYLELGGKLFGAGSFAKGGEFGHTFNGAGKFEDGGYMAKGEDYEYYNKFGLEQSDFEQIVEVWHMHEKTPTEEVEKQYNMVLDAMEDKYGEAKIDDVVDDIHHRHGLMKIMNYAKGGKTGKRLVMYFYFNANDLNISILSPLLEKYTKDWEMFDDKYRMVRAYVKESEAKDLKNELNSYGAVNDITTEKAPDRYAYEGGIRHYAKGGLVWNGQSYFEILNDAQKNASESKKEIAKLTTNTYDEDDLYSVAYGVLDDINDIYDFYDYDDNEWVDDDARQICYNIAEELLHQSNKSPKYAKGGKVKGRLSDTHKYVPNRMIQEIEVERKGKTSFIDGADILDGVYVKKGVKFAHGGSMPHVHSKKHKNG